VVAAQRHEARGRLDQLARPVGHDPQPGVHRQRLSPVEIAVPRVDDLQVLEDLGLQGEVVDLPVDVRRGTYRRRAVASARAGSRAVVEGHPEHHDVAPLPFEPTVRREGNAVERAVPRRSSVGPRFSLGPHDHQCDSPTLFPELPHPEWHCGGDISVRSQGRPDL
jgi:hypothetical protein